MADYQLRQRDYLLAISRAMTSRLDLPSVLRLILQSAAEILGAEAALIATRDSDGAFHVRASYGISQGTLELFKPLLENIPILQGQAHLATWHIPDLPSRVGLVSKAAGIPLRQVIALPLLFEEHLIGVTYIFRMTGLAFSGNDRQVLASFADQAAIAVHNARLYQQLLAEKSRLRAIIEHSADGVLILDRDCRIDVFNHALSRMTGWRVQDVIGRKCSEVFRLKNQQGLEVCGAFCPIEKHIEGALPSQQHAEQAVYVEGVLERPDKSRLSLGITHALLSDAEGRLINVIANVHDITRFREAEELKSIFISIVSHELKTPVALIKGYADTLSREDAHWDEETLRDGLKIIEQESDRLDRLIDNLLDASRIEAGGLRLKPADFQLSRMASRVVEKFRTQTHLHQFEVDFSADFPLVYADEERMNQVFYNLLSNAIKYSPRGGKIRLSGRSDERVVRVCVADEGIGIPVDEQPRLFQRFYRVDSSLSRRSQGAGLGLYLCRVIVEAHGGRIWVEGRRSEGTTICFTLPRQLEEEVTEGRTSP